MKSALAALALLSCVAVSAQNTPAFIQSNTTGSANTSSTLAFSSNVTAGHALYAALFDGSGASHTLTFTDSQANTWTTISSANLASDGDTIAVGCAIAGSSGADTVTFAINGSTSAVVGVVYEVSNSTCTPDVTPVSADTLSQTSCSSGSLTTSTANDLVFGFCGLSHNQPSLSAGSGWLDGSSTGSGSLFYGLGELQIAASPGAYTATSATFPNGSSEQAAIEIAFKATPSGGGGGGGITGSGTANTIPIFTSSTSLGNSVISQSNGFVGIGTTTPAKALDVRGGQALIGTGNGDWGYNYGLQVKNGGGTKTSLSVWEEGIAAAHVGFYPNNPTLFISNGASTNGDFNLNASISLAPNGNVGIGVSSPQSALQVGTFDTGIGEATNHGLIHIQGNADVNGGSNGLEFKASSYGSGFGWKILSPDRGNGNTPLSFAYRSNSASWTELMTMRTDNGDIGIGTTNPQAKLEVNGGLRFTNDPAGSVQTTAWTGVLCGGDYAEAVHASGPERLYEPGDVLVLSLGNEDEVQKSAEPYSTTVAGIFATKPGVIGRRESLPKDAQELPMAMVGIVPTKVTTENGPIRKGDLLVTSSAPGYAMKGTDRSRMLGAVIGKAMGTLDSGTGMIEVLVTLQ